MKFRTLQIVILTLICWPCMGCNGPSNGLSRFDESGLSPSGLVQYLEIPVISEDVQRIRSEVAFSAIMLEFEDENFPKGTKMYTGSGDSFEVYVITGQDPKDKLRSPLFVTDGRSEELQIDPGEYRGLIKIYLLGAPPTNVGFPLLKKGSNACEEPEVITTEEWRKDLPDPVDGRAENEVNHLIVHHSATSNNVSDYLQVVRNIYLYHTEVNGWDDIGYNYLIDPDGVVYEGRDDQGVADQDNIKGAHFCGKNTGTMGICMIGNYNEIRATKASISALQRVLTWKSYKDVISPLDSSRHPDATGDFLAHIAGHRDGCATLCPGDSLYASFGAIRDSVQVLLNSCPSAIAHEQESDHLRIFINDPASEVYVIGLDANDKVHYKLYDLTGRLIQNGIVKNGKFTFKDNTRGILIVELSSMDAQRHMRRRLLRAG